MEKSEFSFFSVLLPNFNCRTVGKCPKTIPRFDLSLGSKTGQNAVDGCAQYEVTSLRDQGFERTGIAQTRDHVS